MDQETLGQLLAVLTGQRKPTEVDRRNLLRVATMCGVVVLFERFKEDVTAKFSAEELKEIVDTTEPFIGFTIEHIFQTALHA